MMSSWKIFFIGLILSISGIFLIVSNQTYDGNLYTWGNIGAVILFLISTVFYLWLLIRLCIFLWRKNFARATIMCLFGIICFAIDKNVIGWIFSILGILLFLAGIEHQSVEKSNTPKRSAKVKTWAEQVAETRECVDLYFQKNKVGDLRNIKDFLVANQCLVHGDEIWHEIVDEINQLVRENKIIPLSGNEHVWESQYDSAKIATKIIKLD